MRWRLHSLDMCASSGPSRDPHRRGASRSWWQFRPWSPQSLPYMKAMHEQALSNSELARRLGKTENTVRRLVDPDHSGRIEGLEAARAALGRRLVVEAP